MRRALAILLAFLFIGPELPARAKDDWAKVERLKPDTPVHIWLRNNDKLSGQIQSVVVPDYGLR